MHTIPTLCGVYYITDPLGAIYVGKSADIWLRIAQHVTTLKANKHICAALQRSFNQHGRERLTFTAAEECDPAFLKAREAAHYWGLRSSGNLLLNTQPPVDIQKHFKRSPRGTRAVLNETTGALYPSLAEAAIAAGFKSAPSLHHYIRQRKPVNGQLWRTIDWSDYIKMTNTQIMG